VVISASSVPRALKCTAWLALPREDYQTAAAQAGTDRHADLEAEADLGGTDGIHPDIVARYHPDAQTTPEAAFAYDVATDTARALGHGRAAYVDLGPLEIPGTADLVLLVEGQWGMVVDHKSYKDGAPEQLATYALMLARTAGLDEVHVALNYAARRPYIATLTALDLDAHAARLKTLLTSKPSAPNAGPWCEFCPAFLSCPAQAQLVPSVDAALVATPVLALDTDEDAARAYDFVQRLGMLMARAKAALIARASERPIPLGNGKVFGPHEKKGATQIDGDIAYALIRERFGQAKADAAVTRKVTQAGIERAVGKADKKAVMAELESRSALTHPTRTACEEH
jgi:hypothetical protein